MARDMGVVVALGRRCGMATAGLWMAGLLTGVLGPVAAQPIELSNIAAGVGGWAVSGEADNDGAGNSVCAAGDVNGDGVGDVIIGASSADPTGSYSGRAYVVFGKMGATTPSALSTITAGTGGFAFNGEAAGDFAGGSVSGAGDVNGDGLADVIIGARGNSNSGFTDNGRVYVVFGKTVASPAGGSALSTLVSFGIGGFALNGAANGDLAGAFVAAAGDVNGDGLADLLVSAPYADQGVTFNTGRIYVVFGKTSAGPVGGLALSSVGGSVAGFLINGEAANDKIGLTDVCSAGDVNGDGLADILVSAPLAAGSGGGFGRAYVVFGKTTSTAVNLTAVTAGAGGFTILREAGDTFAFSRVAGLGDMNGDGLSDFALASPGLDNIFGDPTGRVYVVFGKTSAGPASGLSIGSIVGAGGFRIDGGAANDNFGDGLGAAGDVNGDGRADLIIGARDADANGTDSGRAYLVFGKSTTTALAATGLANGTGGFVFDGELPSDWAGYAVSGAGDTDADGKPELLIGAIDVDTNGPAAGVEQGRAYIADGGPYFLSGSYSAYVRSGNAPPVGIGTNELGNDRTIHPDARVWIDFTGGTNNSRVDVNNPRSNTAIAPPPTGSTDANLAKSIWIISTNRTGSFTERMTFRYTDADISGIDESTLTILQSSNNNDPNSWSPAFGVTVDAVRNEISGNTAVLGATPRYYILRGNLVAPVGVTISPLLPNPTANQTVAWTITFDQPVGDTFTVADIVKTGSLAGTARDAGFSGDGQIFTYWMTTTMENATGTLGFNLSANAVTSATGATNVFIGAPSYSINEAVGGGIAGDVNKDGAVNTADITTLGNFIVNGTPLP